MADGGGRGSIWEELHEPSHGLLWTPRHALAFRLLHDGQRRESVWVKTEAAKGQAKFTEAQRLQAQAKAERIPETSNRLCRLANDSFVAASESFQRAFNEGGGTNLTLECGILAGRCLMQAAT